MTSVLFLPSNPDASSRSRLDTELKQIREQLYSRSSEQSLILNQSVADTVGELIQTFQQYHPQIVHFSGSRTSNIETPFTGDGERINLASPQSLVSLFSEFPNQISCVILSGVYTKIQAKAISEHVPFLIEISHELSDREIIAFGIGFYQAIAYGKTIEDAFYLGSLQMGFSGLDESLYPKLTMGKPAGDPTIDAPPPEDDEKKK
jgi:hypothetical protein